VSNSLDPFPIRPRRDIFLIVSSALLALFTAGFLLAVLSIYQTRIQTISLRESRFIKTEWQLLQDLKAQTDRELLQKDQEIADLNRNYLSMVRNSGNEAQIENIQSMLQQARAQRETILARRESLSSAKPAQQEGWLKTLPPSGGNGPVVTRLLQSRVTLLEGQLSESRRQTQELAGEVVALNAQNEEAQRSYQALVAQFGAAAQTLQDGVAKARRKNTDPQPPSIEELNTRVLVRAIVGSPEVRVKYPDLLKSLDDYLRDYALQERAAGRQEAYGAVGALLKRFNSDAAVP